MKSWIIGLIVVTGAVGGFVWQQGITGNTPTDLTDFVPADTAVYIGGRSDTELVTKLESLYLKPSLAGDIDSMLLEVGNEIGHSASIEFLRSVNQSLLGQNSAAELYATLGISTTGQQQFYLDGLVPVVHLALQDPV